MKRLYIAEKPSVARVIAESLGISKRNKNSVECIDGSVVTWCFGHMFEQAEPDEYTSDDCPKNAMGRKFWRFEDLPIIPIEWKIHPKTNDGIKEQLKIIKQLINDADEIVNAGDPDREGQLLVDEILREYKFTKSIKRYWANAQDKVSVERALANLDENSKYTKFGDAALCRSRADWIVGMNLSRAYTIQAKTLVTMGRVQSPTLKLVVDRDEAIKNFIPVDFYRIIGFFGKHKDKIYSGELITDDLDSTDLDNRIINKDYAKKIVDEIIENLGEVESYISTPKKKNQPLGMSLSDITAKASARWGLSASETLNICQKLYELKLTSYPRTDCSYLPLSQKNDASKVLYAIANNMKNLTQLINNTDVSIKSRIWDDIKTTAHHAIVPTMEFGDLSLLNDNEMKIYELVCRVYIAQFYPPYEYMQTEVITAVKNYKFKTLGIKTIKEGWKSAFNDNDDENKKDEEIQKIPELINGDKVNCYSAESRSARTKPPAKFTEGTLIKAMENIYKFIDDEKVKKILKDGDGIGTSATRAGIVNELKNRKFLVSEGKCIVSTETGKSIINVIPTKIKSPVLTAVFEGLLSNIEKGEITIDVFMQKQIELVESEVERVRSKTVNIEGIKKVVTISEKYKCMSCGKGLIRRKSIKNKKYWWGCSGYPTCTQTYFDIDGKPDYSSSKKDKK